MFKSKGTAFLFDALLASANKRAAEASPMGSILADAMHAASTEIDRLNNELESTTRHMEMAEAAWLRETAGNTPEMRTTPGARCRAGADCPAPDNAPNHDAALTDAERECLEWAAEIAGNCEEFDRVSTLRGLLARLGGGR